jgi:hypothetical protein
MPFSLQDAKRAHTAEAVLPWRPLGARMMATQAAVMLTTTPARSHLRAHPIDTSPRHGRVRRLVAQYGAPSLTINTVRPPVSPPVSAQSGWRRLGLTGGHCIVASA